MKNYEIKINSNMTCEIEKYLGSDTEVYIPSEIYGYKVTGIGDSAFYECIGLTSVIMPDSVASIGEYAFYSCDSLISVTMGNGVVNIGESAFEDCGSLANITIPNGVKSIGKEIG